METTAADSVNQAPLLKVRPVDLARAKQPGRINDEDHSENHGDGTMGEEGEK